jgi:indolepyruvate ferredoxin oxidoreductase beta subunit
VKVDVVLAGVGGQGLLSLAAVIGGAALERGLHLKQSEVHGMAQRGGVVSSHLRLADRPIHSDLIPRGAADLVLSLEPMEALRYLPFLTPEGTVVTSTTPVRNIDPYPDEGEIRRALADLPRALLIDAEGIAQRAGSPRRANLVLLGAAAPFLHLSEEGLERSIGRVFAGKGDALVEANRRAFRLGLAEGRKAATR